MSEAINRYDRQERIKGWNQELLTNAKVAIIGSSHLSCFLTSSLAALGVGDIRIYDNNRIDYELTNTPYYKREFLLSREKNNESKVETIAKKAKKINPLVNISGIHMGADSVSSYLIEHPDIMIIATNNTQTIDFYNEYCAEKRIRRYLIQGDKNGAHFKEMHLNSDIEHYTGKEQEGITSEVISGFFIGEFIKDLKQEKRLESMEYSLLKAKLGKGNQNYKTIADKKAMIIGAGALGNFAGIGLCHSDIGELYIIDDDIIEQTNLNRQILFYDKVGNSKSLTLAERLSDINPEIKINPIQKRVNENFEKEFKKIKPDVILDCVDNLETRAILNHFAIKYKTPLISGGTDFEKGQVAVYRPNKSLCLDCRLNVDNALVKARQSRSCIYAPNPSVIVTNHIIGALMSAEARCVLNPYNYGGAIRKMLKYDSTKDSRVGLIGSSEPCECKRRVTARTWIKRLMSKNNKKKIIRLLKKICKFY